MVATPRILVLHGPNLNLLGQREPDIYGRTTLTEIDGTLMALAKELGAEAECFQSNYEGALLERLHEHVGTPSNGADGSSTAEGSSIQGILINPAGLTHTSVVLRDALLATGLPVVEVHLSNVFSREAFRHHSFVSDIAIGVFSGLGVEGYRLGLGALVGYLRR